MTDLAGFVADAFSDARMRILETVQAESCRYVDLARSLRISEGELSRHLKRLVAGGFLVRDSDGRYSHTGLATAAITEAGRLRFLTEHAPFFASHRLDGLPPHLLERLPELAGARAIMDPFALVEAIQVVFGSVRERFLGQWIIGTEVFTSEQTQVQKILRDKIAEHRTNVRMVAIEDELPRYTDIVGPVASQVAARTLPHAPTSMAISDTHALLGFNDLQGRIDGVRGFWGDDPGFLRWCEDAFAHYWESATPAALLARP